jgi:hypothetical protein
MVRYERKAISLLLLSREPGSASPALWILSYLLGGTPAPESVVCRRLLYNAEAVNPPRVGYRFRQFSQTLFGPSLRVENKSLLPYLSTPQIALFRRMQPSEQAHALQVFGRLRASGQRDRGLLAAALLHDVGKILYPLSVWERVIIVVVKHLFPKAIRRWGMARPRGLRRPFVVAARHAEWGADLAARAGASPRTVELIRRHQDPPDPHPGSRAERLLAVLRQADDNE